MTFPLIKYKNAWYQDMHLLEFVLGMAPKDITDEFERMKSHTEYINNEECLKK